MSHSRGRKMQATNRSAAKLIKKLYAVKTIRDDWYPAF